MNEKIRVLFVCVHNAARSQMAEALLRDMAGDRFEVESAGFDLRPLNPLAVEALRRIGIDIGKAQTKAVFDLARAGRHFHYVISVCDQSTGERCPIFPGVVHRLSWSFADPSQVGGTPAERLAQVEAIRDAIRARLNGWVSEVQLNLAEAKRRSGR
jgi:arsenate reductase